MVKVKLYIEGGGAGKAPDSLFRNNWQSFFEKARVRRGVLTVIRGKGRGRTFDLYQRAVKTVRQDELPLLLVDSEDLVASGSSEWTHLENRDGWQRPQGAGDQDAFLMVCCMETWFLADRAALRRFFHGCWNDNALPQWHALESVPKDRVIKALAQATASCGKNAYAKGKISFDLLKQIDPALVEAACPGAKRLLDRLRGC